MESLQQNPQLTKNVPHLNKRWIAAGITLTIIAFVILLRILLSANPQAPSPLRVDDPVRLPAFFTDQIFQ